MKKETKTIRKGTIKRIHINKHNIVRNNKTGSNDPVITVKNYKKNRKGGEAIIYCPCCGEESARVTGTQAGYNPLKCGANVWVQCKGEVIVKPPFPKG